MLETFIAYMLVCSIAGDKCNLYQDKEGMSASRTGCLIKLDALAERIKAGPQSVRDTIGEYDQDFNHRGFCIDSQTDPTLEIPKRYDL